jgi:hypothetical protein
MQNAKSRVHWFWLIGFGNISLQNVSHIPFNRNASVNVKKEKKRLIVYDKNPER